MTSPIPTAFAGEALARPAQTAQCRATSPAPVRPVRPVKSAQPTLRVLGRDPPAAAATHTALLPRLRAELRRAVDDGQPTLGTIARRLGVSRRTLNRRLRALGTSFQGELDDVRLALARRYLEDPHLVNAEIAKRLGFSAPRAFHRAFKRWTGESPRAWRARHRARALRSSAAMA